MNFLLPLKNFLITASLILRFFILAIFYRLIIRDKIRQRQKAIELTTDCCRKLLRVLRFEVQYNLSKPDLFTSGKKYFMVCNHMSYMDIVFLSGGESASFVTSVEMKHTPFLGDLAQMGGSYFVERRDRTRVPGEIKDLAQIMRQGFHVFVFPEGTSTNGMQILPFKKALFTAAIEAGQDVLPICLRYESINGELFSEKNKDHLCWYGAMPFTSHFLKILKTKSLKVSVNYLQPISVKDYPDRHLLADMSYQQIAQKYFEGRTLSHPERNQSF